VKPRVKQGGGEKKSVGGGGGKDVSTLATCLLGKRGISTVKPVRTGILKSAAPNSRLSKPPRRGTEGGGRQHPLSSRKR